VTRKSQGTRLRGTHTWNSWPCRSRNARSRIPSPAIESPGVQSRNARLWGFSGVPENAPRALRTHPKPPHGSQGEKENPSISLQLTEGFWFVWGLKRPVLWQLSYRVKDWSLAHLAHGWQAEKCVLFASVPSIGFGRGRFTQTIARARCVQLPAGTHSATQGRVRSCSPSPDVR